MTDCLVDSGATVTNVALTLDTAGQVVGPTGTRVAGLSRDQLLQAVGVKTADLLNIQSITCRPVETTEATAASFGLTLGHSAVPGSPDSLDTPVRSVAYDAASDVANAFHYVHTAGAAFGDHELPLAPEEFDDPAMPFKTALRWRQSATDTSGPFALMDESHVDYGVVKTEANGAVKYLVSPESAEGPSAMWRLLEHNKNSKFCNGRYSDANRTEVNYEGKPAVVMSESDFNDLSTQLRRSLGTTSKFNGGLHVHCMLLSGKAPSRITVPLVITRKPRALTGVEKTSISMADLSEVLSSAPGRPVKPLTKQIHPDAAEDCVATFTPLTAT